MSLRLKFFQQLKHQNTVSRVETNSSPHFDALQIIDQSIPKTLSQLIGLSINLINLSFDLQ